MVGCITDSMDMNLRKLGSEQTQGGSEAPGSLVSYIQSKGYRVRHDLVTEQQQRQQLEE